MKKRIVVKVDMHCKDCRAKALRIASQLDGAEHVGFQKEKEGEEEEVLVVIGDGIEAVKLVKRMRKKVGRTKLLVVEDHKD